MHVNEKKIDEQLVKQLLRSQFEQWSDLPLKRIESTGTDNIIYRLGNKMCIRLPRVPGIDSQIEKDRRKYLSFLAHKLPLSIPQILGQGEPEGIYPGNWLICPWLEGNSATIEPIQDEHQAAIDLANILVKNGRINAVIDFDMFGIGDPACDLLPAWGLFSADTRKIFRSALVVDNETWMRGCGWALSIGLIILPYYMNTNPGLVAIGRRLISEVLADFELINSKSK